MPNLSGGHWNEPASQASTKIGPVGFPIWFSNSHCYSIICQACRVVFYQMWETQYQIQAKAREEGMLPHGNNLLRKNCKGQDWTETFQIPGCCEVCFNNFTSETFSSPKARCSKDLSYCVKEGLNCFFSRKRNANLPCQEQFYFQFICLH